MWMKALLFTRVISLDGPINPANITQAETPTDADGEATLAQTNGFYYMWMQQSARTSEQGQSKHESVSIISPGLGSSLQDECRSFQEKLWTPIQQSFQRAMRETGLPPALPLAVQHQYALTITYTLPELTAGPFCLATSFPLLDPRQSEERIRAYCEANREQIDRILREQEDEENEAKEEDNHTN